MLEISEKMQERMVVTGVREGVWIGGVDRDEQASRFVQRSVVTRSRCTERGRIPLWHNRRRMIRNN